MAPRWWVSWILAQHAQQATRKKRPSLWHYIDCTHTVIICSSNTDSTMPTPHSASVPWLTCIPMEDSFRLGTGATRGSSTTRLPLLNPDFRHSCWTTESLVSVEALAVAGMTGSLGVAMGVGMMCGGRGIPRAKLLARVLSRLSEELLWAWLDWLLTSDLRSCWSR